MKVKHTRVEKQRFREEEIKMDIEAYTEEKEKDYETSSGFYQAK